VTAGTELRILVVEDEVLIALELEYLLEDLGHSVAGTAASSAEAIALGRSLVPDVALVDIHLIDGPTGVDVARTLSADPRITVLFMTANAKRVPDDFAGALGVIAKPYSERAVASALAFIAERRSGHAPPIETVDGLTFAPRPLPDAVPAAR